MVKVNELYKPEPALSRERELDECIAEMERELGVRHRCFRAWIDSGRLSRVDAAERFERLATALKFLDKLNTANVKRVEDFNLSLPSDQSLPVAAQA